MIDDNSSLHLPVRYNRECSLQTRAILRLLLAGPFRGGVTNLGSLSGIRRGSDHVVCAGFMHDDLPLEPTIEINAPDGNSVSMF